METPYSHEEHPYTFAVMPSADGSIKSVLGDLIDIQRYINRLIVMIDFIMGSSAKGVLMVPEDCIPEGMTTPEFASAYTKADGVIVYNSRNDSQLPHQISANSTHIGPWDMLKLEINMLQQISGVSGAIQGHTARSGTPSSLYAQEAQNSMLNYLVVFDAYKAYQQERDEKLLKTLMQYYTDRRHVGISGDAFTETARYYDPHMAQKIIDFNLVVSQSNDTPVFRQAIDDMLLQLMQSGAITFEMFLDNTSMPFADKLKADLKQMKEEAGSVDPQQLAMAVEEDMPDQQNPQALALAQQYLGR